MTILIAFNLCLNWIAFAIMIIHWTTGQGLYGVSSNAGVAPDCHGEVGAKPEGKAFDLPVDLHSSPYL